MSEFNPYWGQTFFGFFQQLFFRLMAFLQGEIGLQDLASDEIQLLVLTGVAISSALVGTFLILRKMVMLANALSHTILLGIVLAFVMTGSGKIEVEVMLFAAVVTGLVTAFLTEFLTYTVKLQEDASTGLVFSTLFALGVVLVTVLTRNAHIGAEIVMGNVDALRLDDCKLVYVILAINLLICTLFYKEFAITTFDAPLAKAFGISPVIFGYLLMTQISTTAIGAFRAVGVLMVLAFITGPPLAARLLTSRLNRMLILSSLIAVLASLIGVALSRHLLTAYGLAFTTAGVVVCVIVCLFLIAMILSIAGVHPALERLKNKR